MRKRIDANQQSIVNALRSMGCTVQLLADVGNGCPDVLVGYRGKNILIEIKDGKKSPSRQALTTDQINWHNNWRGQADVVNSVDGAIELINILK